MAYADPDSTLLVAGAVCTAVLVVVSTALSAAAVRQNASRGLAFWLAGAWLAAAGAALAALWRSGFGQFAAGVLLSSWPLALLMGFRRFNARQLLPGNARIDAAVAVVALALCAGGAAALGRNEAAWLGALVAVGVHLYAAVPLVMGTPRREGTPQQALAAAMALTAFLPGLGTLEIASGNPMPARVLAATLGVIVAAFVVMTAITERTERQLRESRRRLRVLANLDALTQVPNRRHFQELATRALNADPGGSAVLLIFDIDHFKRINDHFGHAVGDQALCRVAAAVQEHLRAPDVAGRHGGDEFVLLLRRATTRDAMGVAARIVAEVQAGMADEPGPTVSLSFGMVQVGHGEALDDALRRADQALYEAKRQGRSRAVAASGDESRPVFVESQRLGLEPA
jgi:diguanylate cyclase (GGDEF)-like protein